MSLFCGTTPLVTAWLVGTYRRPAGAAYYLMGGGDRVVTMLFVKETAGLPLRGSPRQWAATGKPLRC